MGKLKYQANEIFDTVLLEIAVSLGLKPVLWLLFREVTQSARTVLLAKKEQASSTIIVDNFIIYMLY